MSELRLVPPATSLLSVAEAAVLLPVSRETIRRRLRAQAWPGGRCGRRYVLPRLFVTALAAAWASGSGVSDREFAALWAERRAA